MKPADTTPIFFLLKEKVALLFIAIISLSNIPAQCQDTFSIVAVDPETGEVGSAGASCLGAQFGAPEGCILISDVHPGVGAIHTQAYYLLGNQNYARELMDSGYAPQQIIDSVVAHDIQGNPLIRQYGVVDFSGAAAYTGTNCDDYKNHIVGPTYSIQGNILLGQQILDSMQSRFLNTEGPLACKLMAALQGANVPGADTRCLDEGMSSLSAFVRVAKASDTTGTLSLDLNVKSVPDTWIIDPIYSLQKLFDAAADCENVGIELQQSNSHQIYLAPNPANDHVTLTAGTPFTKIEMYDLTGRKLMEQEFENSSEETINWNASPGAIAFLKVWFSDKSSAVVKLLLAGK